MNTHVDKIQENKKQTASHTVIQKERNSTPPLPFTDNHPATVAQTQLQEIANNNEQIKQAVQLQTMVNANSTLPIQKKGVEEEELQMKAASVQRQNIKEDEELLQGKFALIIQKKENKTGLPDNLKSGIESLTGHVMDDVKVHYNSDKPAQLQAHAYAQGTDIHIATGQEKHLPHEAWHVVQQKQGRVQPTLQMKDNVSVNDDAGLENEADVMGEKALSNINKINSPFLVKADSIQTKAIQRNVVVEASLDPLNDSLFSNIIVAGRPPTLLGATQGNHSTPFAVFVSGIRNHIRGRTYKQAFNNILSIANTDYEELPGMSLAPSNTAALAAYQNFLGYANAIDPDTRSERHWIEDIQQLTARYLTFRNLVPLSTEASDTHGANIEGDITQQLELIDTRLKDEPDYQPPKDPIKVIFDELFDQNTTLGADALKQHKISIINAYPTTYDYVYS
ncbi:hypothetical protein AR687_22945 [Flavobacteriaceae bacterium CRH]|nr:hypothetical protein AR687_22945 [Flavobacteriaceae bacterium CRH]